MNKFRTAFFALAFVTAAALSGYAQGSKIAFIATPAFYDEKEGITSLVKANAQLETEFGARAKEITDGNAKLQAIATEIERLSKLPQSEANNRAIAAKQDEGASLKRQLEFKREDLQSAVDKRRRALMEPINADIQKALTEYVTKNGYTVVLDIANLAQTGTVLFAADSTDITTPFIKFYNARPAGSGTASATPAAAPAKKP